MSLFGLGKKKEEVKIEPACACNGEVATYEASSCCCGGQQIENCCGGDNKVTSIKVLGAGCKSCHDQYENVKKAIEELGLGIEVEYITDMEKVMAYGVMSMPALVVNEKVVAMVVGVIIGKLLPAIPNALGNLEISGISIPIAILIWIMIYPMMLKVDFQSIKQVGKNPKGLFITWITNWLIKPFTMYGIATLFLFTVFKGFIAPELATQYLAGAVLLGAAPCTAMVFVWSTLTKGNPAYTVVQVATNDLIILIAFVPIVKFLLGVSNVSVPYGTLFFSVILFVVIPLVGGVLTRIVVVKNKGIEYFENTFVHKFDNATTVGLLLTLVLIFASQTEVILSNPLHIVLIAVPLTVQTVLIFFIAYSASKIFGMSHDIAAPAGMIGASNFFELAVAVAIALFGTTSPAALATTVGVLTEVPVMLALVKVANITRGWFKK